MARREGATIPPPLKPDATAGQKWRFRRNVVIYTAWKAGLSYRFLADVFDLPQSRIGTIIKEFKEFDPNPDEHRPRP